MRMTPKLLLALFISGLAPLASATSLGEGQIQSYVGEPLVVNIPLMGGYNGDVKFFQVRGAECRTSVIGTTANGCDSLYERPLAFSVRQRPDGRYFLRVTGDKSDDLYYHFVVKAVAASGDTVFNSFDFLPEFKPTADVAPTVETASGSALPKGNYGVVMGKVIEIPTDAETPVKKPLVKPAAVEASREIAPARKVVQPVDIKPSIKMESRLQIKKVGEYADDIQALQKENGEIEAQIVLLEKHINLLKEVVRLKNQIGTAGTTGGATASASAPIAIAARSLPQSGGVGMLTWILLFAVVVLSGALGWMYLKMKSLMSAPQADNARHSVFAPAPINEKKSLDLTGAFIRPKW